MEQISQILAQILGEKRVDLFEDLVGALQQGASDCILVWVGAENCGADVLSFLLIRAFAACDKSIHLEVRSDVFTSEINSIPPDSEMVVIPKFPDDPEKIDECWKQWHKTIMGYSPKELNIETMFNPFRNLPLHNEVDYSKMTIQIRRIPEEIWRGWMQKCREKMEPHYGILISDVIAAGMD